jgi:hypothetical protein
VTDDLVFETATGDPPAFSEMAPRYHAALMALGTTHLERARRLGVSLRQVHYYLDGELFPSVRVLKRVPEVEAAFMQDFPAISEIIDRRKAAKKAKAGDEPAQAAA